MILVLSIILIFSNISAKNFSSWHQTDSLNTARSDHASVVLADGNILVTGGIGVDTTLFDCEIYDYQTGKWFDTTPMNSARRLHKMILLPDNKVLVIGGWKNRSCEIYDPINKKWSYTDSLQEDRWDSFTATSLHNGNVLITGGYYLSFDSNPSQKLNSCEIYDYKIGKWSYAEAMSYKKTGHSATLLDNGNVLITGGITNSVELNICELFDPNKNSWTIIDTLESARYAHNSILLDNGNVLISGGTNYTNSENPWLSTCELFTTENNSWNNANSLEYFREDHLSFDIGDSNIIIFGGGVGSNTWEIFNTDSLKTIFASDYPIRKERPTGHKLHDGRIIAIGGITWTDIPTPMIYPTGACEIYDPQVNSIVDTNNNPMIRNFKLIGNYPNPFNPQTEITYRVVRTVKVKLAIYNTIGQQIDILVENVQHRGNYKIHYNGAALSSGIYFITLSDGKDLQTKKMIKIN